MDLSLSIGVENLEYWCLPTNCVCWVIPMYQCINGTFWNILYISYIKCVLSHWWCMILVIWYWWSHYAWMNSCLWLIEKVKVTKVQDIDSPPPPPTPCLSVSSVCPKKDWNNRIEVMYDCNILFSLFLMQGISQISSLAI